MATTTQALQPKQRGIFVRNGSYWISYRDCQEKRHREKAGTFTMAEQLLAKRRTERLQGQKLPETGLRNKPQTVLMSELFDDALEYSRNNNSKRATMELELKYDILRPLIGSRPAAELTKLEVTKLLAKMATERDWSPGTFNRWQAAISLSFRWAMENDKASKNPASKVRRKVHGHRVRYLTDEEEVTLRKVIQDRWPEYLPAFEVSLYTGMRAGEQLGEFGMTWNNVDFKSKTIYLGKTKSGKPRNIQMNSIVVAALELLKDRRDEGEKDPHVFLNTRGKPLRYRDFFEKAVEEAKLQEYTWHCNRHTFISRLVMAGVDLRTVADLAGHETIQMTMRYAHLCEGRGAMAVERLVK